MAATLTKAGRYEIVGELGRGAMGVVYKAMDPVIGRTVAVKTVKLSTEGTGLTHSELLARFQTEARAAGLLTHPNIVVVFDAGEEDGLYYITMELVEGKSLQNLLDDGHAFPLPRVLRIMEQACSALQFAHERNVVHRDIKPANLMLTADDTVKVTDFGTAKIMQFGTVSQTAHVMGTPSYMSPEQVKGRAVDGRSDIFSLGVMLYEMITGEKPFSGQNITTVIYKIVHEEPPPPKNINPSIHAGISAVVMRALAKDPETRYQSCREMLEDLRNYRALPSDAGATTVVSNPGGVNATVALRPGGGLPGMHVDPTMAAADSLAGRAANPMQTPGLRRTGPITPVPEPKKKSVLGTLFAALVLIGVIAYCAKKLLPVYYDVRGMARPGVTRSNDTAAATQNPGPPSDAEAAPAASNGQGADPGQPETRSNESTSAGAVPAAEVVPEKPKRTEPTLSPAAAEYKGRIEQVIEEKGLGRRAKVQGSGSTLIVAGKLRPSEHAALLKFLRDAPSAVHLVDHVVYDDAPDASAAAAGTNDGGHPVPKAGLGAIHLVTDVIGATATLRNPFGRIEGQCQTPCSFNNLFPDRYGLDVRKEGYQPVETALQVKAGAVTDQKMPMESLAKGLYVTSQPPGADVFINGAKQSGQTPVTLPLAAGQYNLVLRLQGYEPYAGSAQVKDNKQTELAVTLNERSSNGHVAWAQVHSNPAGAEILLDGDSTGKLTPARIEVPIGIHTITLRLDGYKVEKRPFQANEGGTVPIEATLKPK
jgi:eukaryotic-like serine/threonine-protein kinase